MEITKKLFVLFFCFFITTGLSWNDCPYGMVNDTYPGECGKYIDTNNNGICDHSEPAPNNSVSDQTEEIEIPISGRELKQMTIKQICEFLKFNEKQCNEFLFKLKNHYNAEDINKETTIQYLHDKYNAEPSTIKNILSEIILNYQSDRDNLKISVNNQAQINKESEDKKRERMMLIFGILTVVFYIISKLLVKYKKINPLTFRKIWNWILLISFILLTISTILLAMKIYILYTIKILELHEISGIILIITSLFHIWERRNFFKV